MAMRALSATQILATWETGAGQHPLDRALTILAAAGGTRAELARLAIGERDRRLWKLRAGTLGPSVEALAQCPACGTAIEFQFTVGDVQAPAVDPSGLEHEVTASEWTVRFRLPDSCDLAAIATEAELAARCVIRAERAGVEAPASAVPEAVWEQVEGTMALLDPQAEVSFALECPACGHAWTTFFDIAAFFWSEITALARRLLREVDILARAYGWTEREILGLTPARRQSYLELAQA